MKVTIDPNPCLLYPWSADVACPSAYSGAHACDLGAEHAGPCRCGQCEQVAKPPHDWSIHGSGRRSTPRSSLG